jgi:Cu+-exporting ATPase
MALEPEEPSLDDAPNPELVDFTRRTWVAVLLAVPLLAISMLAQSARSCDFGQVEERTLNA